MAILKTLIYFSIFKHPLSKMEIYQFSNALSLEQVNSEIATLLKKGIIFKIHDFYLLTNNSNLIERRKKGNKMAKEMMPKAIKVSNFIAKFPYIECVSLSGALSKGYYDKDGDIDFFIITKPNRLWIARTLLILYKKIFLLNSKKYFCVNYFISSNALIIPEQNRFTATEMATLIPVNGKNIFRSFINKNNWVKEYYTNIPLYDFQLIMDVKKPSFTLFTERIFNSRLGDFLDEAFRKLTLRKWNAKFGHLEKDDFKIAMKSTKKASKHHPQNFQKTVIELLNTKYEMVKKQHNIELKREHA